MVRLFHFIASIFGMRHSEPRQKPWTVDRDGRVRTDKDRPVILRAK